MINISQHSSSSYAPRTYANATWGDVTAAIAVDYSTAGERLTKKAAGNKFIALPIRNNQGKVPAEDNAEKLISFMLERQAKTINIAGNGIYTFGNFGFSQEEINLYVTSILEQVHRGIGIQHIYSGGQTGTDYAGIVAATVLGIDSTMHMPHGFRQRGADGVDINRNPKLIYQDITRDFNAVLREMPHVKHLRQPRP